MKKIYLLTLLLVLSSFGFSQEDVNCYDYYYKVFKERGAYKINDGAYENVIVSIRSEGETECLIGKVEVKGGAIVKTFLMFEDDTYELYDPKFKNDYPTTISRGVSRSQITMDDEIVNVFFVKKIKPKKKKYKKAKIIKIEDL